MMQIRRESGETGFGHIEPDHLVTNKAFSDRSLDANHM